MSVLHLRDCVVDFERSVILRGDEAWSLTPNEAALLRFLAARPGELVPREEVEREVFGMAPGVQSRAAAIAVRRLRSKLERDPVRPEHLHTVRGHGFRLDLPPGAPAIAADTAGLVGRDALWEELRRRAGRERWLTLVGPPGVGKSRLARALLEHPPDGLPGIWVDLEAASGEEDVLLALGRALGVERPSLRGLVLALRGPRRVFLDGAEAVTDALRPLVLGALEGPGARLVVTSQRPVVGGGEGVLAVPPLDRAASIALVEERVRRLRPGWSARGADRPRIEALVQRLDGLPLAVELAAGRLGVLGPEALARRLDDDLAVLAEPGGPRSLARVLDRALGVLDEAERALLEACAAFAGSAPPEAIEAVSGRPDALDVLHRLLLRGLVSPDGDRIRLLSTVRERVDRWAAPEIRARHAAWLLDRTEAPAEGQRREALGWIGDLLAVVRRPVDDRLRVRAAVAAALLLSSQGQLGRGLGVLGEVRGLGVEAEVARRREVAWAMLAFHTGRIEEAADVLRCVVAEPVGATAAEAHLYLGHVAVAQGRLDEAEARYRAAEAAADRPRIGWTVRSAVGNLLLRRGETQRAVAVLEAATDEAEAHDPLAAAGIAVNLATAEQQCGRLARALALYRRAAEAAEAAGETRLWALALGNVGSVLIEMGDLDDARRAIEEGAALARAIDDRGLGAWSEGRRGLLDLLSGRPAEAEEACRRAMRQFEAIGQPVLASRFRTVRGLARWLQEDLVGARADLVGASGEDEPPEAHAHLAICAAAEGDADEAERLLALAGPGTDPPEVAYLRLARGHLALCRAAGGPPEEAVRVRAGVEAELALVRGSSLRHQLGRILLARALARTA